MFFFLHRPIICDEKSSTTDADITKNVIIRKNEADETIKEIGTKKVGVVNPSQKSANDTNQAPKFDAPEKSKNKEAKSPEFSNVIAKIGTGPNLSQTLLKVQEIPEEYLEDFFDVLVAEVLDPHDFYIQLKKKKGALQRLMNDLE